MEYAKVIDTGESYTTHPQAVEYGCTNYQYNEAAVRNRIYKIIRAVVINNYTAGFSIDYNGKHYLIGADGVVESTREKYEAQFQQVENDLNNNQIETKMKVKCINQGNFKNVTLNQEYEVVGQSVDFYHVVNNAGNTARYSKEYFEVIEEELINVVVEPQPEFEEVLPIEDEVGVVENEITLDIRDGRIRYKINGVEYGHFIQCGLVAGNCGIESLDGLNDMYDALIDEYEGNIEEIIEKIIKEILAYYESEASRGCILFSTNNYYEHIWNVMNSISTGNTGSFYNQNSDNDVNMWWFIIG